MADNSAQKMKEEDGDCLIREGGEDDVSSRGHLSRSCSSPPMSLTSTLPMSLSPPTISIPQTEASSSDRSKICHSASASLVTISTSVSQGEEIQRVAKEEVTEEGNPKRPSMEREQQVASNRGTSKKRAGRRGKGAGSRNRSVRKKCNVLYSDHNGRRLCVFCVLSRSPHFIIIANRVS